MLVCLSRNWQGWLVFIHSPSLFLYNHFSRNCVMVIPKCGAILFRSWKVNVGVILRQQFEQAKQSTSSQTSFSICTEMVSRSFGGLFSTFVKNLRRRDRCFSTFWLCFLL